jgi:hypothetical protein
MGEGSLAGESSACSAATDPMENTRRPPGLIQRYREALQTRHYARRTVNTYEQCLRRTCK